MNNTNETKWNAGVRRTASGLFNYEVLDGYKCVCTHTTASQSPATLATFQQIVREHNERPGLIDALKFAADFCESTVFLSRQFFDGCAWETLRDAAKLRADNVRDALKKAGVK